MPISAGPISAGPISAGPISAEPISARARISAGQSPGGQSPAGPISAGHPQRCPVSRGPISAGPTPARPISAGANLSGAGLRGPISAGPIPSGARLRRAISRHFSAVPISADLSWGQSQGCPISAGPISRCQHPAGGLHRPCGSRHDVLLLASPDRGVSGRLLGRDAGGVLRDWMRCTRAARIAPVTRSDCGAWRRGQGEKGGAMTEPIPVSPAIRAVERRS